MKQTTRGTRLRDELLRDPANTNTYLVYADLLTGHGDPRGELIALHHAARHAPTEDDRTVAADAATAHLAAHADALLGPIAPIPGRDSRLTWRYGFIESLAIEWSIGGADLFSLGWGNTNVIDEASAIADLTAMLEHESTQLATELALICVPCEAVAELLAGPLLDRFARLELLISNWVAFETVATALGARPRPRLTALSLGMAHYGDLSEHTPGSEGLSENEMNVCPICPVEVWTPIAAMTPNLVDLKICGPRLFDGIAHPGVRTLDVIGMAIQGVPFDLYNDASPSDLAALETLHHTAVNDDYRAFPITPIHLEPARFPKLRALVFTGDYDLGNAQDTLFGYLAASPILPQLRSVHLPILSERYDGETLELEAPAFRHLAELRIDDIDGEDDDEDFEARVYAALPIE